MALTMGRTRPGLLLHCFLLLVGSLVEIQFTDTLYHVLDLICPYCPMSLCPRPLFLR
jgi:hypothetical protein